MFFNLLIWTPCGSCVYVTSMFKDGIFQLFRSSFRTMSSLSFPQSLWSSRQLQTHAFGRWKILVPSPLHQLMMLFGQGNCTVQNYFRFGSLPPKSLSLFGDCSTDYLHFRKFSMTLAFKDRLSACSVIRRRLSSISSFFALSLLSFGLSLRVHLTVDLSRGLQSLFSDCWCSSSSSASARHVPMSVLS